MIRIEALYIYPIKSLASIRVDQAELTKFGLKGDREWMVVNAKNAFVTQRQNPLMSQVHVSLTGNKLTLRATNMPCITVAPPTHNTPIENVTVWKDACQAQAAETDVNTWLTQACQSSQPLRLMRFYKPSTRTPNRERFGENSTFFADAAPYLITNQASLDALNTCLTQESAPEVSMARFRPNIVISGLDAFTEQNKANIHNEDVQLALIDHCQRCAIITIDPKTGLRDANQSPFKTLTQLNSMPNNAKAPAFGMNSVLMKGDGCTIKVGDGLL